MRLLEREVRIASITACAPGPSRTTQASNFSFCSRSAAFCGIRIDSIPNCLKQSVRTVRWLSLRSTRAIRALAFLLNGVGAKAVPRAFCMGCGAEPLEILFWRVRAAFAKVPRAGCQVQKCHYERWTDGLPRGLAKVICRSLAGSSACGHEAMGCVREVPKGRPAN